MRLEKRESGRCVSQRREVFECVEKLRDLSEQLNHFVEREWVDPPAI